jgi:putative oxidoreductase
MALNSGIIYTFDNMSILQTLYYQIIATGHDDRSLIPRIIVGLVFLSEGLQKVLIPGLTGVGRFEKIGFENAEFLAYFVASFEILCGIFLLFGFLTRLASIPLLVIMLTAIVTTKIPKLMNDGFWTLAHDSRTDFAMTMLLIYLIIYGAGNLSLDSKIFKGLRKS